MILLHIALGLGLKNANGKKEVGGTCRKGQRQEVMNSSGTAEYTRRELAVHVWLILTFQFSF